MSNEIEAIARQDAGCERLMSVPGVGPIISSAMVAAIGAGDERAVYSIAFESAMPRPDQPLENEMELGASVGTSSEP